MAPSHCPESGATLTLIPGVLSEAMCHCGPYSSGSFNLKSSLVAQMVKNLPAMQETPVRFLGGEDPLEKGTATHSSILAWRIPWGRKEWGTE